MNKYGEIRYFREIEKQSKAKDIIDRKADVIRHALSKEYGKTGLVSSFSLANDQEYAKQLDACRKDTLAYCGEKAGIPEFNSKEDVAAALDNPVFTSVYNAIEAGVIRKVMSQTESNAINVIANVETVGLGNSKTYKLDSKGLPVAQRGSYGANVAFLNDASAQPLTITPKVYSLGIKMDALRILTGEQDWAQEMAKVIMGLLYAQYKLVVNTLFSTTLLTSTPFAPSTFNADDHIDLIDLLQAVNKAPVTGYGTISALRKIGIGSMEIASGVYGGYGLQDSYISQGFVSHVNGIDYVRLNQAFDYSVPLEATLSAAVDQLLIPTDKVLLLSAVQDKPVKLVRENFVRVREVAPNDNATWAKEYAYFMSFEAGIATLSQFALQGTA